LTCIPVHVNIPNIKNKNNNTNNNFNDREAGMAYKNKVETMQFKCCNYKFWLGYYNFCVCGC